MDHYFCLYPLLHREYQPNQVTLVHPRRGVDAIRSKMPPQAVVGGLFPVVQPQLEGSVLKTRPNIHKEGESPAEYTWVELIFSEQSALHGVQARGDLTRHFH